MEARRALSLSTLAICASFALCVSPPTSGAVGEAAQAAVPSLEVNGTNIRLAGRPFFPVIAIAYQDPDARWVSDVVALGANTVYQPDRGCLRAPPPSQDPQLPDLSEAFARHEREWADEHHRVLRGRLRWLMKDSACLTRPSAAFPEAIGWNPAIRTLRAAVPTFGGCDRTYKAGSTTQLFAVLRRATRKRPIVFETGLAEESVPGRKTCLSAVEVRTTLWTAVAAGVDGFEYWAIVPAYTTNTETPDLIRVTRAVRDATATFSARIRQVAPVILAGRDISGSGFTSSSVRFGAWRVGELTYVVAVNTRARPTMATIRLTTSSRSKRAAVMWESRTVKVSGRTMNDQFGPFAVHVYKISE